MHQPLPALLADAWAHWPARCRTLTETEWTTPTRCQPWTVHALAAHVAPDPALFEQLPGAAIEGPPAVDDPVDLLRRFNDPDGVAHTMAGHVADAAVTTASSLPPAALAERFERSATFVRERPLDLATVLPHPVIESTTLGVMTEIALMEAVVHHLDLAAAVGGPAMPDPIVEHVGAMLSRLPDTTAMIEAITGRRDPGQVLPALR